MNQTKLQLLQHVPLLAAVEEDALQTLAQSSTDRKGGWGSIILEAGEDRLAALTDGAAAELRSSPEGDELLMATYGGGEVYGLELVTGGVAARSKLVATAHQTKAVVVLPDAFRVLLRRHPEVLLAAFDLLARRSGRTGNRLEDRTLYNVATSIAHELDRQAGERDDAFVSTTHAELGAWIGASSRKVGRGLGRLEAEGLIAKTLHRRGIVVLDRKGIASYRKKSSK